MLRASRLTKLGTLACAAACAAASLVAVPGALPAAAATCSGNAPSDFNGDGISDAAISDGFGRGAGRSDVHVIYGTPAGLTANASGSALDDQFLIDDDDGSKTFGSSLATGDFNGDGCGDLAVGDPDHFFETGNLDGTADLFFGSPVGLPSTPLRLSAGLVPGGDTQDDELNSFGTSLAAGDFNGDGLSDLAVGSPRTGLSGAVYLFPGNPSSSLAIGAQRMLRGGGIIPNSFTGTEVVGDALAAGDFNGDGRSDLALGTPRGNDSKGVVVVLRGTTSSSLLTSTGAQTWTEDSAGILGTAVNGDEFGFSLAVGSFTGNGRTDLAIGVPHKRVNGSSSAGAVNVMYSAGSTGLSSTGNQLWTRDSTGLDGESRPNAQFGNALAAGDFDGSGAADLAVAALGAPVNGAAAAGNLTVIAGVAGGLTATGSSRWSQASAGIADDPEANDNFGSSLAALRVTATGHDDLLVGVAGEGVTGKLHAGVAEFIPGSTSGLTGTGSQLWSADSAGIAGTACQPCRFGLVVG